MAECTIDNVAYDASNGPVGAGTPHTGATRVLNAARDALDNARRQAQDHAATVEQVSTAGATNTEVVPPPISAADKHAAGQMGRRAAKFWDWGTRGQEALYNTWQEAVRMVNGTGLADVTWWNNMQTRVAKWFTNEQAGMVQWLNAVGNMTGRMAYQNPLTQAFTGMIPKIRGMHNIFVDRHENIMRDLQPIARRTGHSTAELFDMGGHYLNCLHAEEGNAHLLRRWQEEVDTAQAKLAGLNPDKDGAAVSELNKTITEYSQRINELTANLDNPNPPVGLRSRGYTNAQAKAKMLELERASGMTREELTDIARRINGEYNYITEELSKAGLIPPEQLARIPDFEWYAPQLSRETNLEAVTNDTSYYIANSFHAMDGLTRPPDSAATSLGFFSRRAATEIGMQDFGSVLYGLYVRAAKDKQNIGLRMETVRPRTDSNSLAGMLINVPVKNKDGNIVREKRHFYFDPNYRLGNMTGADLNTAMNGSTKLGNAFVEALRTATSYYGQSFTRFQPGFAIVGGLRDFMERAAHMVNRTYWDASGRRIDGASLVKAFMGNSRRANRMLRAVLWGKTEEGSAAATMWNEFQREGLFQKYLPDKSYQPQTIEELSKQYSRLNKRLREEGLGNWADELEKHNFTELNRAIEAAKGGGKEALRQLDRMNDWLQNTAAFSHYMTLREAGLTAKQAGAAVREMMDMTKAGTVTQYLSIISPFMRPTMQGAQAIARTFGLSARNPREILKEGKQGWALAAASGMAFSALYPMLRETLGQDETGNYRMDNMSITRVTSSLPLGIGDEGEFLRIPMGFGPIRLAATMGVCMDRLSRGKMEPSEAAFEMMFAAGRDLAPSNTPGFDFKENPAAYITHMMAPAGLKPFIELGTNVNNFGSSIYNEYDPNKAKSAQGRKSTPALWHQVARWVHESGGPDLQPEQYMHFVKGISYGPLRLITSSIVDGVSKESPHQNWETPTPYEEMPGWLKAMGLTLFYGREARPEQYGYYEARKKLMTEVKRLNINLSKEGKKGDEGIEIVRKKLEASGMDADMQAEIMLLMDAEKQLRGLGSEFNKKWGDWYNTTEDSDVLKQDFSNLSDAQRAVYIDFLTKAQAL